ncbi:MAG: hypothetical protein GC171_16890 [Terrimonas sp.]|nr:hypothetical protein [Terrimonas sp.]
MNFSIQLNGIEFVHSFLLAIFTHKLLFLKRFQKILKWFFLTLLLLVTLLIIIINSDWGQNYITGIITKKFSKELNTKISIQHVGFSLFNKMNIEGVFLEDRQQDTLLFAGKIQVRITDWFFFKDKVELKYVGLENAVININRKDSVWNYQFLVDYFSSPGSSNKKEAVALNLKNVALKNVWLLKKDQWRGEDISVRLQSMDLDANEINFSTRKADINSLDFSKPVVTISNYAGLRPDVSVQESTDQPEIEKPADTLLHWNPAGWVMHIGKINIRDGLFKTDKDNGEPVAAHFDGRHIEFSSIDGRLTNLNLEKDTISVNLSIKTKERSGFEVRSMVADTKITPGSMTFDNMEIHTNKSVIRRYYAMHYDSFNDDMNDYIDKVNMNAEFDDAEIDSDDIAFFAPGLADWKKTIRVNGKARGTVSDLFANNLEINAGGNTYLNGDISLVGLPNINQTFIDFKANRFRTNYADATRIFPQLKGIKIPRLDRVQYLDFTGSFTGFIRDFVTYGHIRTNLGTITSDLNMKLPEGAPPLYSGNISGNDFQLGKFLNTDQVGNISFDSKVLGRGFKWETLVASVDGKIKNIVVNNYQYENIIMNGQMDKRTFQGYAAASDNNFDLQMNGLIDFNGEQPKFDLIADINKAKLMNLKLTREDLSFNGRFTMNFTGSNIDNFLGTLSAENLFISHDTNSVNLKKASIISGIENGQKQLKLASDEFNGSIAGDFSIRDLPAAFSLFLNKYYPSYVKAPKKTPKNESFSFDFHTRYVDEMIKLVDPRLTGFNNSSMAGTLNLADNELELKADVPFFAYKQFQFNNTNIQGIGNFDKLEFSGTVDQVNISDSSHLPTTRFSFVSQNDISNLRIETEKIGTALSGSEIKARVQTYNDGVAIQFDSSSFTVNGKRWNIEKDGELSLRQNTFSYGQLVLKESNQELKLTTVPSGIGDWNDIRVDLKNINMGDISPYLMKKGRMEGLATGTIRIEDPQKKLNIVSDINTSELRWDDDSIGEMNTSVTYINKTGELTGKATNTNPDQKISLDLKFFLKDSTNTQDDILDVNPENYPIKIIERFTGSLFTDLHGFVTGKIRILNPGGDIKIIGKPRLKDASLTVDFTKCHYYIEDNQIEFTENEINLGTLTIRDRYQRSATVEGWIKHNSFQDMSYNITARTGVLPLELINTTAKDNSSFYGRARGTGSFSLTGPQTDMQMKIKAVASYADSSFITIPSTESKETGISDFLVERKYGRELLDTKSASGETNVTYDVDLTANELVTVKVILDELTGDEIVGRGEGNLKIRSGTNEELSIRGRYDITEGDYKFTFQSFIRKPFKLQKNAGNYIEWTGDPYNAKIKIDAVYGSDKKVSFAPIVNSGNSLNSNNANIRDYVYVIAKLRGDLFRPDISFELDFPEGSPAKTDPELSFTFKQLQSNEDELNKQVAYLILSDNFAPLGNSTADISSFSDAVLNTITGKVANEVNKLLNNFLTRIDPNLRVNFNSSIQRDFFNQKAGAIGFDRASSNLTIGRSFFNERVILTVEGAFDVPFRADANYTTQLLPNITTEILINKSGTIRATFFYKENIDFLTGASSSSNNRARKYGASIAYRKEANTIWELLGFRKKQNPPKNAAAKKEEEIQENKRP